MSKMEAELKNSSGELAVETTTYSENYAHLILKRFKKHKMAVTGVIFIFILAVIAVFAPLIAPKSPYAVENLFGAAPSSSHVLGTDQVGRDVLSRLVYGVRISLIVGIGTMILSVSIGTILGLISGYFGGKIDMIIMRITDIFMSFPQMMLILIIVSIVGPGLKNIIWVLGLLGWPGITRLVRGNVLSIKQMDYIKSAVVLGFNTPRLLFSHVLPNTMAPILVNATFGIARAIIYEASLSFLGMGVQPPTASWGNMLTDAQALTVLTTKPWLWFPPGIMIIFTVLAFNFIGDGLRDAFDPRNTR